MVILEQLGSAEICDYSNVKDVQRIRSYLPFHTGDIAMEKVKVTRYVTGKRPDYAPESSSDEEQGQFELAQKKKLVVEETEEVESTATEIQDRRLRRLQEREVVDSDDEDDRLI